LFSPIAAEMSETMYSITWVRQDEEKIALANISGAMLIQVTNQAPSATVRGIIY
jgi:cation:H+ antiporter